MTLNEKIAALPQKSHYSYADFIDIVEILRSEQGCPWDREQNHQSIRKGLIEETYEVVEAIDNADPVLLREELGDLLLQIVFHAQIEREEGRFEMDDVINDISKKMIHRHPHVFGDVHVKNSSEVLDNWEVIKTEEKQRNTLADKLRAIPPMMPALMRAAKVGKKAGISDGQAPADILAAIEADLQKAKSALTAGNLDAETAVGSLLLQMTSLSRALDVEPEYALTRQTEALNLSSPHPWPIRPTSKAPGKASKEKMSYHHL